MANRRVLIVEDEAVICRVVSDALQHAGYEVLTARDGEEGLRLFNSFCPHLVVADIMMPRMDGLEMVSRMRALNNNILCLFLSARSGAEDVVEGFRAGGNDYLRKPFSMEELLVRIEALLSRLDSPADKSLYNIGEYLFDSGRGTLQHNNDEHHLSARETAILAHLAANMGRVVSSRAILLDIWGDDSYYNLRSLNVFVSKLRSRFVDDPNIEISAVRGVGYRLTEQH